MRESIYLYKHCLRSLDCVQFHTTGTDGSLRLDNLFLWVPAPLFLMLSTLAYKAEHAWLHLIFNSASNTIVKNLKSK